MLIFVIVWGRWDKDDDVAVGDIDDDGVDYDDDDYNVDAGGIIIDFPPGY